MTNYEYIRCIWHYKVEDNLPWDFCAQILYQNYGEKVDPIELETIFKSYFRDTMGIEPYSECPICGKELIPKKSRYNDSWFIGCSGHPECKFLASITRCFVSREQSLKEIELIERIQGISDDYWACLYFWMQLHEEHYSFEERQFIRDILWEKIRIADKRAKRANEIINKSVEMGFNDTVIINATKSIANI